MENEENQKSGKARTARKKKTVQAKKSVSNKDFTNELVEPRWSVVTFEIRAASNLTYAEAARKLEELEAKNVAGLCIVTDEAAERVAVGSRQ